MQHLLRRQVLKRIHFSGQSLKLFNFGKPALINRYTVIGNPIAHSVSPDIHHVFGELSQRRIQYSRTEATPENFADVVRDWKEQGGLGCNVTMPFKSQAMQVVDRIKPSARRAGALNTVFMHKDGSLVGHNTDGSGLLADLCNTLQFDPNERRVLMIGAGGASRGVLGPLLDRQPSTLVIANRTLTRAQELAEQFAADGAVTAVAIEELANQPPFDLVLNATSSGLTGEQLALPNGLFAKNALAYDMVYSNTDTPFMAWARTNGAAKVIDGFGMLVEQAADAFLIWQGIRPKTRLVYPRLSHLRQAD